MRFLISVMAAVLCAGAPASAEDGECLNGSLIRSMIDTESPKIEKVISARRSELIGFEQVFNLKGGITASFTVIGCNGFAVTLSFRPVEGLNEQSTPEDLVRAARRMLNLVPFKRGDEAIFADVRKTLAAADLPRTAQRSQRGISFECGGAQSCDITVPKPRILEFGFLNTAGD